MSKQLKLPTLLIVSDNPSIRVWIKKQLEDQFFLLTAERRQEALSALQTRLDFIVIDSALEECDALKLCKELRQAAGNSLVPILLITGRLKQSFRDKALRLGVTDFLSDELDLEELQKRIATGYKAAAVREKTEDIGLAFQGAQRRSLNDQALKRLAAAKAENRPTTLLLIRIDGFEKMQNKKEILSLIAKWMEKQLPEKGLLCPASEGTFLLLLPEVMITAAQGFAEKLRTEIQKHSFLEKQITLSIAIPSLEVHEQGFDQMIEAGAQSLKAQTAANRIIHLNPGNL